MAYSAEIALWRAVLLQAFIDASAPAHSTADRVEKGRARNFLLNPSAALSVLCEAAEVDMAHVNREAKRRSAAGWPMKRTAIGKHGVLE